MSRGGAERSEAERFRGGRGGGRCGGEGGGAGTKKRPPEGPLLVLEEFFVFIVD